MLCRPRVEKEPHTKQHMYCANVMLWPLHFHYPRCLSALHSSQAPAPFVLLSLWPVRLQVRWSPFHSYLLGLYLCRTVLIAPSPPTELVKSTVTSLITCWLSAHFLLCWLFQTERDADDAIISAYLSAGQTTVLGSCRNDNRCNI